MTTKLLFNIFSQQSHHRNYIVKKEHFREQFNIITQSEFIVLYPFLSLPFSFFNIKCLKKYASTFGASHYQGYSTITFADFRNPDLSYIQDNQRRIIDKQWKASCGV